ncbi:MAG: hypothetical protein EG828_08330, partial [Deltaproteobacteria bacterium]|nr:hypothetical protein [Deltaproteobacteria bacterium]
RNMPALHLHCDFREHSLSRAIQEARRLERFELRIIHVRSMTFDEKLHKLASEIGDDDQGLITLLHAQKDQLDRAGKVVSRYSLDLRSRITLSCSRYAPGIMEWAHRFGMKCEENCYEAPRHGPWNPKSSSYGTTLQERQWIQYRLMRALIAGELPETVFREIIDSLRRSSLSEIMLKRAMRFHVLGEPDMAGGHYAEERRQHPNAIDRLRDRAVQVGRSGLNTLIIGETGTGKEALAWYLHDFSTRCDKPFLAVNCAFFEGERLESELFGHEQGAFTEAKKAKKGLVEEANGGSLFLDELPEM